ncbi:MAG TPA: hypothetical protein VIK53_05820 [Verrucomicrobiae bacterium]
MNVSENKNNFTELKRFLNLKRHEVPPPGYFNDFSAEIVARIRAGEASGGRNFAGQLQDQAPWLVSFLRIFEARPGVIGAFATSLCLLLLFGVVVAEYSDSTPQTIFTTTASASQPLASSAVPGVAGATAFAPVSEGGIVISTNASLQPAVNLFGQQNASPLFQPVGFTTTGD